MFLKKYWNVKTRYWLLELAFCCFSLNPTVEIHIQSSFSEHFQSSRSLILFLKINSNETYSLRIPKIKIFKFYFSFWIIPTAYIFILKQVRQDTALSHCRKDHQRLFKYLIFDYISMMLKRIFNKYCSLTFLQALFLIKNIFSNLF